MNNDQFESETAYQISLSIAKTMLRSRLLTDQKYAHLKTLLIQKYNPPIGVLFADNS